MNTRRTQIFIIFLIVSINSYSQETGTFKDTRDGKIYKTVKIGTQTWMAENLAYKANDGCWAYNNDENNAKMYGYLYNFDTAREVCPDGWHLPQLDSWKALIEFVGKQQYPEYVAGRELKEKGFKHWQYFEDYDYRKRIGVSNGNDTFGFTALPAGDYNMTVDKFGGINWTATWWVNIYEIISGYSAYSYSVGLLSDFMRLDRTPVEYGLSVRCIKD